MPANRSDPTVPGDAANEPQPDPAPHAEPQSRAERRAARAGRTVRETQHWSAGKITGARSAPAARRQYSNRRSGG
jgi:hypothetical protein